MGSFAAEVSLHCVICFEEFCIHDRPPVVLPCGHTYVCIVCAKRLKRCMECREPLFWMPPVPKPSQHSLNLNTRSPAPHRYGHAARGRYSPGPQTPPHPSMVPMVKEEPVPLPLPKNTVLMGMIESAERQKRLLGVAKRQKAVTNANESDDAETEKSQLDPILAGMSAFVGTCGTYAVREPLGLAVLPFDPNKQHHHSQQDRKESSEEEKKADEPKDPFTIDEGQTVQVVGFDEGVYQLARGAGYVMASKNQLVKVGGPLEKSCQLEGMLQSVLRNREEVQGKLDEVDMLANGLREKIQLEQENPEDHPVISAPKRLIEEAGVNDANDLFAGVSNPSTPPMMTKTNSTCPVELHLTQSTDSTEVELGEPHTPAPDPHYATLLHSPAHSCPMPGSRLDPRLDQPYMDGRPAGLPRYRINSDDDLHGLTWGFGCGTTLFGERLLEHDGDAGNILALSFDDSLVEGAGTISGHTHSTGMVSAARTVTGAETLHRVPASPIRSAGSFDGVGVNFRTGMSGHGGLTRFKKKSSPSAARREIRMMSEHRGIAHAPRGNAPRSALKKKTTPHHSIGTDFSS